MGTGHSQVNFLWLCHRFSRRPLALWYSLRSAFSAPWLWVNPPPIQSDQFSDSKLHRIVILGACGFSCSHWNDDKLSSHADPTTVYYLIYILQPHVLPLFTTHLPPHLSYLTMLLLPSSPRKGRRIESRTSSFSQWSATISLEGIFHLWWALCLNMSIPLPQGANVCVRFWPRWRSAPTWFQCRSISSYH